MIPCATGSPGEEGAACDGVDDDCDGVVDEGFIADESCFRVGVCAVGNVASECRDGVETPCRTGEPSAERETFCDGEDDDCNGAVDEGLEECAAGCHLVRNINGTGLDLEFCTIVPAGGAATFWMGCREDLNGERWDCRGNEHPQHQVDFVGGFQIMRTLVTVADYEACVAAGAPGCVPADFCNRGDPNYGDAEKADHPIVCVTWFMAQAFSAWIGARLPTEAEWAYGARGPMASADDYSVFPWGTDEITPDHALYNDYEEAPVGSYSPLGDSPFGLQDMAGNVLEWTQDCLHHTFVDAPADGSAWETDCDSERRVVRGVGFANALPGLLRTAARGGDRPATNGWGLGFRTARSLP